MPRTLLFALLALGLIAANSAHAAVQTKTIKYKDGDTECIGFLAWDDAVEGKRPGVLVVHEWWGLNDYARNRAKDLAKLGYVAFAADMYGEGKTVEHPQDAGAMAAKVRMNVEAWRKRAQAGLAVLTSQPQCDATKLAAIGYCFGGSTALQLAYTGADLDAVATFHAALPTPSETEAKAVKARVLVCHGAEDKFIPEEAIKAFKGSLDKASAKYEFVAYPGAVHSFTVPDAGKHNNPGMQYQAAADKDSWDRMTKLFAETLKK
ncbi:MAG TPA: dienelactone hydrolase family protein [Planctomycetaceae bacterium]|nr:dienelactone hydrolase family protein [Planctomycetaceae bacterium]